MTSNNPDLALIEKARALLDTYCGATCDLTGDEARVLLFDAAPLRAKLRPLVDGFMMKIAGDRSSTSPLVCPSVLLTELLLDTMGQLAGGRMENPVRLPSDYSGAARLITGERVLVDRFEVLGMVGGVLLISRGEQGSS